MIRKFGLCRPAAERISWFIYLVQGEANGAFVETMAHWIQEVFLLTGSVETILDAISILSANRVDYEDVHSCASVRREVIRYVQGRFPRIRMQDEERIAA